MPRIESKTAPRDDVVDSRRGLADRPDGIENRTGDRSMLLFDDSGCRTDGFGDGWS
ncbi:hypothetical protein OIE68_21925 [Nocardia vinacea]|uniref:hypothetical protein n=1 Tax=Nocardia vinacea TaxID=96468 RepID=UPI002E11B5C0|nr:hypothetical protein OIE68_21925 [Nocardia vinacea]